MTKTLSLLAGAAMIAGAGAAGAGELLTNAEMDRVTAGLLLFAYPVGPTSSPSGAFPTSPTSDDPVVVGIDTDEDGIDDVFLTVGVVTGSSTINLSRPTVLDYTWTCVLCPDA